MYDSLNRALLEPYGCAWTKTPNFKRLAERSVQFANCYVGSLPCMPARRELHTGRTNFLHRSWGPIEPFDDSMPEILKNNGVYTHLVSDHQHYWEDGGATYHTRYSSWESFRGQEGDLWKAVLPVESRGESAFDTPSVFKGMRYQDEVNRSYLDSEEKMPQTQTFAAGMEFIQKNHGADNWFLQIETFDPHEPFYSQEAWKKLYPHDYQGKPADWPPYYFVNEDDKTVQHVRYEYAALLSMCDASLGKVLDAMDRYDLWKDTMLIVNTDHGYLLGEHGWWSKTVMPVYNEIAHTPLFVWDPRTNQKGVSRNSLVQTIDLAPTLLDYFNQDVPASMEGKPLKQVIQNDEPIRDYAVFGYHGGHINITDGRYVYMHAPVSADNQPLYDYTLMPTRMRKMFDVEDLQAAEIAKPFSFTKGCPLLKVKVGPNSNMVNPFQYGSKLFDLASDPGQTAECEDDNVILRLLQAMRDYMKKNESPSEQYERLGIPVSGDFGPEFLAERRAKTEAPQKIGMLEDLAWEKGAQNAFIALRNMNRIPPKLLAGFEAYVRSSGAAQVTVALLRTYLASVLPGEQGEMVVYFTGILGRTE
jgi:arylsulfatase A-like enzyme